MKSIAFISIAFILIMIITIQLFPRKTPCLSQNVYYGTPGLVREGFTKASSYAHCYNANANPDPDESVLNNYPYFAATHVPTNSAVEQQEAINIFNNKVSRYSAENLMEIFLQCNMVAENHLLLIIVIVTSIVVHGHIMHVICLETCDNYIINFKNNYLANSNAPIPLLNISTLYLSSITVISYVYSYIPQDGFITPITSPSRLQIVFT